MANTHRPIILFAVLASATMVISQSSFVKPESPAPTNSLDRLLCNTSMGNANGSGVFSFPVEYPTKDNTVMPDPSWAITVTLRPGEKTRTSLWYDTAGESYDDDLDINYDVCAFIISDIPLNTYVLGQQDPGDCSSMLRPSCADALNSKAAASAHEWVSYTGKNMTDGVLPKICDKIKRDLHDEMLRECSQEFAMSETYPTQGLDSILPIDLTGKDFTNLNNTHCDLTASPDKHFRRVTTKIANSSYEEGGYDNATRSIYPILTVHMPVANADRKGEFFDRANSSLQCVRVRQFSDISRQLDQMESLPEGEPWEIEAEDSALSPGAKGGIGAGVAVAVLLIVGIAVWLFLRTRRHHPSKPLQSVSGGAEPGYKTKETGTNSYGVDSVHYEHRLQPQDATMAELGGEGRLAELAHGDGMTDQKR